MVQNSFSNEFSILSPLHLHNIGDAMKEDKEFEKWWKRNFCDKQGNPLMFISLYKNTLDFKNYCRMAWEEAKKRKRR